MRGWIKVFLGLTAIVTPVTTVCIVESCSYNKKWKASASFVKVLDIEPKHVKIHWSYPEKNSPLLIYYALDSDFTTISWSANWYERQVDWGGLIVTNGVINHSESKCLEVPCDYVWHGYKFRLYMEAV